MVDYKQKYLEMKLKYISTKNKLNGGTSYTEPIDLVYLIKDELEDKYGNDYFKNLLETKDQTLLEFMIEEKISDGSFKIELNKHPTQNSIACIGKIIHNQNTDKFYILLEVKLYPRIRVRDEGGGAAVSGYWKTPPNLYKLEEIEYEPESDTIINKLNKIKIRNIGGFYYYPTLEDIKKAIYDYKND